MVLLLADEPEEVYLPARKAAKLLGVHPITLYRWAKKGKIRCIRTPTGRLRYPLSEIMKFRDIIHEGKDIAIYARVINKTLAEQGLLDKQINFLKKYAEEKGYRVVAIVTDIGLPSKKSISKLFGLAMSKKIGRILMTDLDRILPVFPEILEEIFSFLGVKLETIRLTDDEFENAKSIEILEIIENLLKRK